MLQSVCICNILGVSVVLYFCLPFFNVTDTRKKSNDLCWRSISHSLFIRKMKPPERWRALPRRALFVSIFAQKSSKDVKTSCCDVVPRRHVTSGVMTNWPCVIHPNFENTIFWPGDVDLWPMTLTLTFELGLDLIKVNPHTKFRDPRSNGSAVRALTNRHTDSQTDGTDFIPSTAEAVLQCRSA